MKNKHGLFIDRTGEVHYTNQNLKITIIKCEGANKNTIQFEDGTTLENIRYGNIERGHVRNPNYKSVYGIGYHGIGKYNAYEKSRPTRAYTYWNGILRRCYDEKTYEKHPHYRNCTVAEEWHNFQVFAEWFHKNYQSYMNKWHIDKDILIKGNKIYSVETCELTPPQINCMLVRSNAIRGKYAIGVSKSGNKFHATLKRNNKSERLGIFNTEKEAFECYKFHKESWIKEVADEWQPKITNRLYESLKNYQVEIND